MTEQAIGDALHERCLGRAAPAILGLPVKLLAVVLGSFIAVRAARGAILASESLLRLSD